MLRRALFLAGLTLAGALAFAVPEGSAQRDVAALDPAQARAQLQRAARESERARARAERFAREAENAGKAADKAAREAAAIAAEIQRAEADIAVARARYSLAQAARARLSARLAERQRPLVQLTSALQTTARRPLALSALQPGSLKDLVYVRAVLDSAVPEIRRRTAGLRGDLDQRRALERRASRALAALRSSEADLQAKRRELAQLETRQRFASRTANSEATREAERALGLAEEARDLDGLLDRLGEAASLRRELAALPGPVLRPSGLPRPSVSVRDTGSAAGASAASSPAAPRTSARPPRDFQLPVEGRTIAGFGSLRSSGLRNKGLTLGPVAGAQVVAPATGRVAFAGPYRGFGQIVIIEHVGGWTSLVTGLDRTEVEIGDRVIGGSPLGRAGGRSPEIMLELRRGATAVNPLQFIG
jgi:septal ring factor EnvC (AmiA/AmiB activator)